MRKEIRLLKRKCKDIYILYKVNRKYGKVLKGLKDKHKGERCFIIGNGPSLRMADLEKLQNEICFGANKIFIAFPNTTWRPTYYMIQDEVMIIQELDNLKSKVDAKMKFIYGEYLINNNINLEGWIYFHLLIRKSGSRLPKFSSKIEYGMYEGMTITYSEIQMAMYMGFKEIYLLGVDFNYSSEKMAYFSSDYMGDKKFGTDYNNPDLDSSYLAYKAAHKYALKHGVKIYNATRTTKLDVFDKIDFDSLCL